MATSFTCLIGGLALSLPGNFTTLKERTCFKRISILFPAISPILA